MYCYTIDFRILKNNQAYQEIKFPTTGIYKEKGSKFISFAFPVFSEEDIKKNLAEVKKKEHSARHYCYAYILKKDKSIQKINDDGEPSSTAGKPILGQINSHDLTNILIVVTRYFGGVKLGVSGLINAYKMAALDAISKTKIITQSIKNIYSVKFSYLETHNVMQIMKKHDLEIISSNFQEKCQIIFKVNISKEKNILENLRGNHKLKINFIKTI